MEELASNGVEIYRFPVDDETVAEMNANMNVSTTGERIMKSMNVQGHSILGFLYNILTSQRVVMFNCRNKFHLRWLAAVKKLSSTK